jgi:cholesterol transport system auxiliary component
MTLAAFRAARRWLAAGAALAVAGCASLFVATPPGNLYQLTPVANFPSDLPHTRAQLLVDLPQAPAGIDTSRIALSKSPLTLDYYADAVWTDQVPGLIETGLLASFENTGAITAIDREATGLRADFVLRTEIRHFEAEYGPAGGPPRVRVAIIARLVAMPQRTIIAQSRFEESAPATADNVPGVVAAFDAATDGVLRKIVLWTLANPALSQARR